MSDSRPTVAEPDDDPYLWLEDIDSKEALNWVEEQNQRTLVRFENEDVRRDSEELKAALDRHSKLPMITRRGGFIYNFWTDEAQPRGIWRRTTHEHFCAGEEVWDKVLDLDSLAKAENEDLVWSGVQTLPPLHNRAILQLSHGGSDAVELREWNVVTKCFVMGGFTLGEAMSDVAWLDADTLLLMCAFGEGAHMARSGQARTVRLWRRGTAVEDAPVLFSVPFEHIGAAALRDWTVTEERIVFSDFMSTFETPYHFGNRNGSLHTLDLPKTARLAWHDNVMAMLTQEPWTIEGKTYAPDTVLGLRMQDVLANAPTTRTALRV